MNQQKLHLKSYFGFSKLPFTKYMWASKLSWNGSISTTGASPMALKAYPGAWSRKGSGHYLPSVPSTASSPQIVSHIAAPVIILRTILGTDYGMVPQTQCGTLYSRQSHPLYRDFTGKINWAETPTGG